MEKKISIAIDGPAAAGKSTVAKIVAEKLTYIYIDTGAMYRALTLKALNEGVDVEEGQGLLQLLLESEIELRQSDLGQSVFLDGEDVSRNIRDSYVTNHVSSVASHGAVREEMVRRQQLLGMRGGVVMDGRDIGTKVLPEAELKIFLLASADIRAHRRHEENVAKGYPSDLLQLKEEIEMRDKQDSERKVSPLRKAEGAIEIDTSLLSINEVVAEIIDLAAERIEQQ